MPILFFKTRVNAYLNDCFMVQWTREILKQLDSRTQQFWNKWIAHQKARLLLSFLGLQFFILLFAFVRHHQLSDLVNLKGAKLAAQEHDNRTLLLQMLTGCAVLVGMYIAWVRAKAAEAQAKATQDTAAAANENVKSLLQGQITERFTKAVDQLGSDKIEIRLGSIYALERIMKDSPDDHWTIVEILAAYIRKNAALPDNSVDDTGDKSQQLTTEVISITQNGDRTEVMYHEPNFSKPKEDVQAALSVIVRRPRNRIEPGWVDLRNVDLEGADFRGHIEQPSFLQKTILNGSKLNGADFYELDLQNSYLQNVKMERVHGVRANFKNAHLDRAVIRHATFLESTFEGTRFGQTTIMDANLLETKKLTSDQLLAVRTLYGSKLPPDLEQELRELKPELFEPPRRRKPNS